MLALVLATAAQAAPSASTCTSWGQRLQNAANTSLTGVQVDDDRLADLAGQLSPGAAQASVVGGACKIRSVGIATLSATLTLRDPVAGKPIRCPVSVQNAVVPLEIVIGGNAAKPDVQRMSLPLAALGPYMSTCLRAKWVTAAVLEVGQSWIDNETPAWHRNIETWLAR
ncbi:MAG: hypothetical protein KTR31_10520 [Myxococcales bacterium]|nr:hypothetical protein [Myxococcales bacterium]